MDAQEVRIRCIEAAAAHPTPHTNGYVAGVLAAAELWAAWVCAATAPSGDAAAREVLGLPKKK